jgi:hypothetical protein
MNTSHQYNEWSDEKLENEICELTAVIQAGTYRLLCMVGEVERRQAWPQCLDSNGFRSTAHWLSWKTNLNLSTAREYVRIGKVLPNLAKISTAFSRGELSYSKVRAITRIATEENEEMLLEWALAGTASQVEKLVKKYRQADRPKEIEKAKQQHEGRWLTTFFDSDGRFVIQGRLPPEQGALVMKALEIASDDVLEVSTTLETSEGSGDLEVSTDQIGPQNASAETSATKDTTARVNKANIDYSQRMADALARVAERSLEVNASETSSSSTDRFQVVIHVDAEVLADPNVDGRCELEDGPSLAPDTVRRLACDSSVCQMGHAPDGSLIPGRKSRTISDPLRRTVNFRDGTRCQFPGCNCRGREYHHVEHWANWGLTEEDNLLLMCKTHHFAVHEGGFRVEASPVFHGVFHFFKPNGDELPKSPKLPIVTEDPKTLIIERWLPEDVNIDPWTAPVWNGDPCDYDWAMTCCFGNKSDVLDLGPTPEPTPTSEPTPESRKSDEPV